MTRICLAAFSLFLLASRLLQGAVPVSALPAPASASGEVLSLAAAAACPACSLLGVERRSLGGGIAEYTIPLRVGPGANDRINVHRVVKERAPFVAARASKSLFLAHGDFWNFDAAFLNSVKSAAVPDSYAFPIFLAARGVDVWGIDFRWTLVPAGTTDFAFMSGWNLETDARDLRTAMAFARLSRGLGGDGFAKLHLLGWSRGGQIGYAALNAETQLPAILREIKGFIPVDILLKSQKDEIVSAACVRLQGTQALKAGGQIADTTGGLVSLIGQLALANPAGVSPVVPTFTNRQTGLLAGVATFQLQPPGGANVPNYHFAGGTFGSDGAPNALTYQNETGFYDFLTGAAPFEPLQVEADADAAICESSASFSVPDVAFDDHLGDITVPVLYVGAGGGFGADGIYTTTLLGSSDISRHVVSLTPPAQRIFDIGHADIFSASDAPTLFWQPILDWLQTH